MISCCPRVLVLAAIATVACRAAAAESPSFTLREAIATAMVKSPALKAEAFAPRAAEARTLQAGVRPNPELSVEFENFLGTHGLSGVKGLETTLQLSQAIDLDRSRGRRIAAAAGEQAVAEAGLEIKRLDVATEVARRFVEAVADGERGRIAQEARALGERTVEAVRRRLAAGAASPIDLNKATIALAQLRIEEEHTEHELAACRQTLAAALGETAPSFGPVSGHLLELPAVGEFEVLAGRLEHNPAFARFAAEARWRDAQLRLAQGLRRGTARVSAGLRRAEAGDAFGFVAGVSLPLPRHDQSTGIVRETREQRAQIDAASDALRLELRATLFAVFQEMSHARIALAQLQREVIPTAEQTRSLIERGYQEGRFSLVELLEAQKALVEFRREVVDHAATYHRHLIEVERLVGGSPAREIRTARLP